MMNMSTAIPGLKTTARNAANRIIGKLIITSVNRMSAMSTTPPKNPATAPTTTPMIVETMFARMATSIEVRAIDEARIEVSAQTIRAQPEFRRRAHRTAVRVQPVAKLGGRVVVGDQRRQHGNQDHEHEYREP